ncbi:transposase [Pseudomonas sp. SWRI124]|nr:transposase [Pseudomonas khavaziana]MBV4481175.1 transposase [Pseudomonas khavaziana]
MDVEPAKFFVHHHVRSKYACRPCERIASADVAPTIIDGGMAAAGLITWVLISKYLDHLPLYRLEQIANRAGVTLARSTLADWWADMDLPCNRWLIDWPNCCANA